METKYKMGTAEIFAPTSGDTAQIEWTVANDGLENGTEVILRIFNNATDMTQVEVEARLTKDEVDDLQIALSDLRNCLSD